MATLPLDVGAVNPGLADSLTTTALRVMQELLSVADWGGPSRGLAHVSQRRLAERMKRTTRTVRRGLEELRRYGLVGERRTGRATFFRVSFETAQRLGFICGKGVRSVSYRPALSLPTSPPPTGENISRRGRRPAAGDGRKGGAPRTRRDDLHTRAADLGDLTALAAIARRAEAAGTWHPRTADALVDVATIAVYARRSATDPPRLFAWAIRTGEHPGADRDRDVAKQWVRRERDAAERRHAAVEERAPMAAWSEPEKRVGACIAATGHTTAPVHPYRLAHKRWRLTVDQWNATLAAMGDRYGAFLVRR